MKKNLFILLFVAMLGIVFISPAFAEELVPPAPGVTASEMKEAIGGISKNIKNLHRSSVKSTQRLEKALGEDRAAITTLANTNTELIREVGKIAPAVTKAVGDKVDALTERIQSLGAQVCNNAWILGGMIAVGMLLLIGAGAVLYRRNRSHDVAATKTIVDAINNAAEKVIDEGSKRVAGKIKTLDPMIIDNLVVDGHDITFVPPIVGGMYVSLYVPSTVTPVTNPSQIVRVRMTDKAAVRRSTRKVLAEYFVATAPGAAPATTEQGKQQIALINSLKATPELRIAY